MQLHGGLGSPDKHLGNNKNLFMDEVVEDSQSESDSIKDLNSDKIRIKTRKFGRTFHEVTKTDGTLVGGVYTGKDNKYLKNRNLVQTLDRSYYMDEKEREKRKSMIDKNPGTRSQKILQKFRKWSVMAYGTNWTENKADHLKVFGGKDMKYRLEIRKADLYSNDEVMEIDRKKKERNQTENNFFMKVNGPEGDGRRMSESNPTKKNNRIRISVDGNRRGASPGFSASLIDDKNSQQLKKGCFRKSVLVHKRPSKINGFGKVKRNSLCL